MSSMLKLDKIITSDLRLNILRYFLAEKPNARISIRQLSREVNYSPSNVKRELERLEDAGILSSEKMGNQKIYYRIYEGPLIDVFKNEPHILLEKIKDVTGIDIAYVYEVKNDEFRMVIVGKPDIYFLTRVVRNIENKGGFNINFEIVNREEIRKKSLPHPLFYLVGDKETLDNLRFGYRYKEEKPKLRDYRKRRWER